jgi:hypothetical protein
MFFEVDNAMRLKHPFAQNGHPNSFVTMKPKLFYKESATDQYMKTNEIRSSSYPVWNYRS